MRFTATEEYGVRCLVQMVREPGRLWTIGDVAKREGLTRAYAAKLMAALGRARLVTATRGRSGGFRLAPKTEDLDLSTVLRALDGPLYAEPEFCGKHTGTQRVCVHTTDCNIRGLWRAVDGAVQRTLSRTRLRDLLGPERAMLGAPVATPAVG